MEYEDMQKSILLALLVLLLAGECQGNDNGLASQPPRGWISKERFQCNTDCMNYPDDCISEKLIRTTAQAIVKNGFKDKGYNYIIIDDCWQAKSRDSQGVLQPDPQRFPSGMNKLADFVHSLGLKLGLFLSTENATANGYPGSQGKMAIDAKTLVSWGVDMVTVDSFGVQHSSELDQTYRNFAQEFNKTGKPVLFMCSYPYYQRQHGIQLNYKNINEICNIYKESDDMRDSWEDLEKILKYFGDSGSSHVNYSFPGSWNYANPALVGDFGLSPDQLRMQVAVWTIMASPLLVSTDVRKYNPQFAEMLLNPRVLAIHHDPLAVMGKQTLITGQVKVWIRPIMPRGSFALVFLYTNISGGPKKVSLKLQDIGMVTAAAYNFTDVFTGSHVGIYKPWYTFNTEVNPTGALFLSAIALP